MVRVWLLLVDRVIVRECWGAYSEETFWEKADER